MPSGASLRSIAKGNTCVFLGTCLRIVGFGLVTPIRIATLRGSGAPVSTTWQGLQKKFSSSDCFFMIPTHLNWNHLQDFKQLFQKIPPEFLQHLWAEQNFLIPFQDIFQSHRFMAFRLQRDIVIDDTLKLLNSFRLSLKFEEQPWWSH